MSDSWRPHGLSPTRFLYPWDSPSENNWSGLSCPTPWDLSNPGTEPVSLKSPILAGRFFTTSTAWEAPYSSGGPNSTFFSPHDHDNLENSWSVHQFGTYSHSTWTHTGLLTSLCVSCLWRMRTIFDTARHPLQKVWASPAHGVTVTGECMLD